MPTVFGPAPMRTWIAWRLTCPGPQIPDWQQRYREVAESVYGGQTW